MVVFILAAAAAFLVCVLIGRSPEQKRLSEKAHPLLLILLLFLLAAVLFVLVAATASPREVGVFLLSLPIVIMLYAALTLFRDWIFKWVHGLKWQTRVIVGALPFAALFGALIAWNGDAWAYAILLAIRRIAAMPETTYAVLGAVAGLMCGNFSAWITHARRMGIGKPTAPSKAPPDNAAPPAAGQANKKESASVDSAPISTGGQGGPPSAGAQPLRSANTSTNEPTPEMWPTIIFAAALSCVVLAALFAPYEQSALSRVSGLETPYLKVQFAISPSSAEKQLFLNMERDLFPREAIDSFPRSFRFIQYDCAQAALDADVGINDFSRDQPEKYREFAAGLAFRHRLIPYINQFVNAQRSGHNLVVLKGRAKLAAEKFAALAMKGKNFENNYSDAMSEVENQEKSFGDEGVGIHYAPEELDRRRKDPDPAYCPPPEDEIDLAPPGPNTKDVEMVVEKRPRLILGVAAALFAFEGNLDAVNAIFTNIFQLDRNTNDTNAIGGYADTLYIEGDDLRDALERQQADLRLTESRLRQVEAATGWKQKEPQAHKNLVDRYKRAGFLIRLRLAYMMAQHGLGSEEDLLPQRDLHWSSAQKYADDAYEALLDKSKSPRRFPCTDDDLDLTIKDTYAFVKLAYQAYNLKSQRRPPDDFQVRQAREILEDALADARVDRRRFEEARSPTAAATGALSCSTEAGTRAWVKRISSHLRLADALRP